MASEGPEQDRESHGRELKCGCTDWQRASQWGMLRVASGMERHVDAKAVAVALLAVGLA